MRPGIIFPSFRPDVTGIGSQPCYADFPATNMLDLVKIRRVTQAPPYHGVYFDFIVNLDSPQPIQALALVHHNGNPGEEIYAALFSSLPVDFQNNVAAKVDELTTYFPNRAAGPQTTPLIFGQSHMVQGIYVRLSGNHNWIIGGFELGGFYAWREVRSDQQRGILSGSVRTGLPGGTDTLIRQWGARMTSGTRAVLDRSEIEAGVMDFQALTGVSEPFVWIGDADNPNSWARECYLVRNHTLPTAVTEDVESGRMPFDLMEHLG